jgi:NADPH:quinone reductase-like Zn-dependent oxidoreductase
MANTETTINAVIHPKYNDTPIDIEKTIKALERNNFVVHYFETGTEAISYLKDRIQNKHVAIGDSRTLLKLNAYEALSEVNEDVTDIQRPLPGESFRDTALRTMGRDVFLTSVNALAQTGEMVNIDGTGNRFCARHQQNYAGFSFRHLSCTQCGRSAQQQKEQKELSQSMCHIRREML